MCIFKKRAKLQKEILVAEKDIVVYKRLFEITDKYSDYDRKIYYTGVNFSLFFRGINKPIDLLWKNFFLRANDWLDAYLYENDAKYTSLPLTIPSNNGIAYRVYSKMTIPKGSKYILLEDGEVLSDKLYWDVDEPVFNMVENYNN